MNLRMREKAPMTENPGEIEAKPAAVDYNDKNAELFVRRIDLKKELKNFEGNDLKELEPIERRRVQRLRNQLDRVDTELVELNYGLVLTYVKKFTSNTSKDDSQEFESAARVGLVRAIATYDPTRGRFSTWAYKPIQREVLRAVRNTDYPNMNPGDFEKRPDILRAKAELQAGDDTYDPTNEEVAKVAGTTVDQVRRVLEAPNLESLSKPTGEDGEGSLGDFIEDSSQSIEDSVLAQREVEDLEKYGLSCLDKRELFVIVRRYGLDCEPEQRLSSIGDLLGLSREAVRQVEAKALSKLNHPTVMRKLVRHGRD